MRCRLVCICAVIVACTPCTTRSRPLFAVHVTEGGAGIHLLSLNLEVPLLSSDSVILFHALRFSTGYGISFSSSASFVPIEARTILFHGSNHIDLALGLSLQVRYSTKVPDAERVLKSSPVNPTWSVAYRYESQDGGFSFRLSVGGFYHAGEREWWFTPGLSLGHAF